MAHVPGPTALDELREIAVGRLMLDNIPHIKAYWILMDVPIAQLALQLRRRRRRRHGGRGADLPRRRRHDAAGVQRAELSQWIRDAGRVPVERDTLYEEIAAAG